MKTIFVGDIAGHVSTLDEILTPYGIKIRDVHIPDGTTIVQVGDLVGRSAESDEMVRLVDKLLPTGRWIQVAGNHDLYHVGGHQFGGTLELEPGTVDIMQGWLDGGLMRIAYAAHGILATHAGLTYQFWREIGQPGDATSAAQTLNEMARDVESDEWWDLNRAGIMLADRWGLSGTDPGPVWAEASGELIPPWLANPVMPFDQVHGHSSPVHWNKKAWRNPPLEFLVTADYEKRHTVTVLRNGKTITGIDPGLGKYGHTSWSPLVIETP